LFEEIAAMVSANRLSTSIAAAVLALGIATHEAAISAADPLRVLLVVDSSAAMAGMLTEFRAGLNAFVDAVPEDVEVAIISTGGQLRIRVPPTTDRTRLRQAASIFASDGGANAFLDTLLESDRRLLRAARDRRPIVVALTTDQASQGEQNIDAYNTFMRDFVGRGGRAHGIVIRGGQMGPASQIVDNLTRNTDGLYRVLAVANSLATRMKEIAAQVAAQD
jgi:Mg-chelatase subunit ChlD